MRFFDGDRVTMTDGTTEWTRVLSAFSDGRPGSGIDDRSVRWALTVGTNTDGAPRHRFTPRYVYVDHQLPGVELTTESVMDVALGGAVEAFPFVAVAGGLRPEGEPQGFVAVRDVVERRTQDPETAALIPATVPTSAVLSVVASILRDEVAAEASVHQMSGRIYARHATPYGLVTFVWVLAARLPTV